MSHQGRMTVVLVLSLLFVAGCSGPDIYRGDPPYQGDRPSGGMMMPPSKQGTTLGIPWEKEFGTKEAVRVRDTIFVAGQLSWDEQGHVKGDNVEAQMRQAYANVGKVLEPHGAKLKDVVEETLFVTDIKTALAVAQKVRQDVFGESATVASSIVEVSRLADPKAQVAIRVTAKLDIPMGRGSRGDQSDSRPRGGRSRGMPGMGGGFPPF